jgi:hypothetical protein
MLTGCCTISFDLILREIKFLPWRLVFLITPFYGMKSLEFSTSGPDALDPN